MDLIFIGGFICLMYFAVIWFWNIRDQQVNAIASIVTVLGVLGTFVGIAWGLLQFDTGDIESSVPKLLEGLRIAFITSIAGIAGSIFLKWSTLNERRKQTSAPDGVDGATIDTLAQLLNDILKAQKDEGNETKAALRSIERSLTGEGESTVVTQLSRLRTTFIDKQDDLVKEFRKFSDEMAKKNIEAFIKALENAIKDFNKKISEQFGENFKQLNQAVGKLLEWQEQYQEQMDKLAEEFRIAAESVEKSRQSLEIISNRSDAIVSSAEQLEPILQGVQQQINQLNALLQAFSKLADNAREAFPTIENRLDDLTERFSVIVEDAINDSKASMETQRKALTEQSQQLKQTVENTGDLIKRQTQDIFDKTDEHVKKVIDTTDDFVRKNTESVPKKIELLDKALEKELTASLKTLGSHLKSLSDKFVEDYTPLTESLRNVVQLAENLRRQQGLQQ